MCNYYISSIQLDLPSKSDPSAWAREQLNLGWSQIGLFIVACVGVLTVYFLVKLFLR